ncbi:NADH pyrophosphatase domain-containing protein [Phanerochaete sordida]|uniref:NAD(+) diphosphatase n=1 Tax=Phanerochaete sordida TaxID=48140 RepID=A0A9P3GDM5_9APHY|nr:NADH pyrophosphatase domain-containing protein [Phanerochaete sordida]
MMRSLYKIQVRGYATSAKGHTHYFAGGPLNRLAWLRTSPAFLNAVVRSPETRWVLFSDGKPLLATPPAGTAALARLETRDVLPLLGPEPFFSQAQRPGELAPPDTKELQAARLHGPPAVFLGLHEPAEGAPALPSSELSGRENAEAVVARLRGTPYFSLDVTDVPSANVDAALQGSQSGRDGAKLEFVDGRAAMSLINQFDSGVFSVARTLVDWTARNKFCAGCGSPVYTLWAGWKHGCTSLLPWAPKADKPCPTSKALNNYMHPRTDPVVIILTVSRDNSKVLLGRNRNWPKNFYSALAGFVEPGESHEDTVERELWEEAGVKALGMKYHSTQPWPFPANVMAGYYAVADPSEPVRTDLDNELEDARWFTREEVLSVLAHADSASAKQAPKWDSGVEEAAPAEEAARTQNAPLFKGPPPNAMAGVLIAHWAQGKVDVSARQDGDLV